MRVYFMLNSDALFKPQLLHEILIRCPWKPIGVAEVPSRRRSRVYPMSFYGYKGVLFIFLTSFWHRLLAFEFIPYYGRSRSTIKAVCRAHEVPYAFFHDVTSFRVVSHLKRLSPDVIVSYQSQIFDTRVMSTANVCCINCHPGKLPDYRGPTPVFWAMFEKESEIGVTVHTMDSQIDTGRIIGQQCFPVLKGSTLVDNGYIAHSVASGLIVDSLTQINKNKDLAAYSEIPKAAKYWPAPRIPDLRAFKRKGLRFI